MRGSSGMEAECAKENKQGGILKRKNDRKKREGGPGARSNTSPQTRQLNSISDRPVSHRLD